MRVALIDPSLFTLPYDSALAEGLVEGGHEVVLHGRAPGPADGEPGQVPPTGEFYQLTETPLMRRAPAPLRLAAKAFDHALSMRALLRRLRRERPDAIHFQWLPLPMLDRAFLGALSRIAPLTLTVHDTRPFNGDPSSRLQGLGFIPALRRFHALIVHTAQGRERLRAQGLLDERMSVLPIGRHVAEPRPLVAAAEAPTETTFLMFGKIKPYKGADVLIDAFAALPEALRARSRMRIVGKPYMDLGPLEAQAARLGVADRLSLEPRFIADDEIAGLFGPGTVAVFPYREIEMSHVLSYAAALARPVVASRIGGFAETVIDGEHGVLVEPGDAAGLAAALRRMLEEPGFAERCGAAMGRAAELSPDWDEIGRRTAAVYEAARVRWAAAA